MKMKTVKNEREKIKKLATCAVMVALATVLSFCKIWDAPLGGSVTVASMLPIIAVALKYGTGWGMAAGFTHGCIQLIFGIPYLSYIWTPIGIAACIFFDYILPFTVLGLAGLFAPLVAQKGFDGKNFARAVLVCAASVLTVCVIRYISHVFVGAVVWYEITKNGEWNDYVKTVGMWVYSAVYNIQFMLPETLISVALSPLLVTVLKLTGGTSFNARRKPE